MYVWMYVCMYGWMDGWMVIDMYAYKHLAQYAWPNNGPESKK
jgi:hypothetical protein